MNSFIGIFIILATLLTNSKANHFTIDPVVIRTAPQGQYMAFVAGPLDENTHYPRRYDSNVYVLDTNAGITKKILEDKNVFSLCWRNNDGIPELWISIMNKSSGFWPMRKLNEFLGLWPVRKLIVLNFEEKNMNVKSTTIVRNPDIVSFLNWNPKGTILAGIPKQDYVPGSLNHSVAISFSNGKNARRYSKNNVIGNRTFWATEDTFFTQDIERTKIMEFCATQDGLILRDVPYSADKLTLSGVTKNQPIYRKDNDIYLGNDLLYDSDVKVGWIRVSDPYIAFIENSTVCVIDAEGKDIARKKVGKSRVVGMSASAKIVYLLSGYEKIQSWNFEKNGSIETMFDVKEIIK